MVKNVIYNTWRHHYHTQQLACSITIKTVPLADEVLKKITNHRNTEEHKVPLGWPEDITCLPEEMGCCSLASQKGAEGTRTV